MGTKPCKPVVPYEEVKDVMKPTDFAYLQQQFLAVSGGNSYDSAISRDALTAWLERVYSDSGKAVLHRLFEVLDSDGSKALSFKEFMQGAYVFHCGSREQKLKLAFNMFDLSGGGYISRKDFKKISVAFLVGNRPAQWTVTRHNEDNTKVEEHLDISFFKPMTELMVDMALLEYDRDNDGKLSFVEWSRFAQEDRDVTAFVDNMSKLIPPPSSASAGAGAGGRR